jgi:environmental stress-induced protein Ves
MGPVIRAAALTVRPWPNGLGVTRDVAGQGQHGAQFDWLISIADLTVSAAFSHFPDCGRVFTLIEGRDVTLTLDGRDPMACQALTPAHFPGDHPAFCTMGGGPARAFNVFFDRRRFIARVAVSTIAPSHAIWTGARTVAIFCVSGTLGLDDLTLGAGDTVTAPGAALIRAGGAGAVAVSVEIETLGPA